MIIKFMNIILILVMVRYQSMVHSYVFGPKRASKSNPGHTLPRLEYQNYPQCALLYWTVHGIILRLKEDRMTCECCPMPVFIVRSLWLECGIKTHVKFDIRAYIRNLEETNKQTNRQTSRFSTCRLAPPVGGIEWKYIMYRIHNIICCTYHMDWWECLE